MSIVLHIQKEQKISRPAKYQKRDI